MTAAEDQLRQLGARLADAVEAALPGWVIGQVVRVAGARPGALTEEVRRAAESAGQQAARVVGPEVRRLLDLDVDEQKTTPLALIRGAVRYPTAVLRSAGLPAVARDRFAEAAFPDDIYDLSPGNFADLDPALGEPGLEWGAAKAFVHKQRHRSK